MDKKTENEMELYSTGVYRAGAKYLGNCGIRVFSGQDSEGGISVQTFLPVPKP